jgi:hypothetical protein
MGIVSTSFSFGDHGTHARAARRRRADDGSRGSEFPFAPSMPAA